MLWMAAPTKEFHVFVFIILAFNGITLSMTFGMVCDLNRQTLVSDVVYCSYGQPIANHVVTCGPKLPYDFCILFFFFFFLSRGPKLS